MSEHFQLANVTLNAQEIYHYSDVLIKFLLVKGFVCKAKRLLKNNFCILFLLQAHILSVQGFYGITFSLDQIDIIYALKYGYVNLGSIFCENKCKNP